MRDRFRFETCNERIMAVIEDESEEVLLMRIRAKSQAHWSSVEGYAACDRLLLDL
jgi:hypothetical protein